MTIRTRRRDELAANLSAVRARIGDACAAAGRSPEEITLTVVTKYFPSADVRLLADLGVRDVGENRHQEAVDKAAETADLGLRWHYIGNLQSNKAAAVAQYADVVESVDRAKLIGGLQRGAAEADRVLDCLIQVGLEDQPGAGRSGAGSATVRDLAEQIADADRLRLRGVMAVAPLGAPPRPAFARLAQIAAELRAAYPDATWMSAGMSGDLEDAISCGATHLRIGSAVLGPRPSVK